VGAGALQKAYEQLRNKLAAEGLFADERKRPIPLHPRHVAVVTSPTGAAVRDILNVLRRRVRGLRVTVIPAMVQGEQAPASLLRALSQLEKLQDVDVAIIGRGGGSIEDLWCFNDEAVVRGIAHLKVPVISAVGHEVDFTLSDFVADLRAPTPSAAAELVAKSALEIEDRLRQQQRLLVQTIQSALRWHGEKLHSVQKRLVDPRRRIIEHIQRCDELLWRLKQALLRGLRLDQNRWQALKKRLPTPLLVIKKQEQTLRDLNHRLRGSSKQILAQRRWQLQKSMSLLDSLSPLRVVDRGFALVSKGPQLVMEARQLVRGDCVQLRLRDGQVEAQVTEIYIGKMDHMDHIEPES
jgi:exodeoxyribonuclease VII large subunit